MKQITHNTLPDWASIEDTQAEQDGSTDVLAHLPNGYLSNPQAVEAKIDPRFSNRLL